MSVLYRGVNASATLEGRGRHHGIRRRVAFLLYDNVGAIDSVVSRCKVCAKPAELGLNENSCENDDNFS